MGMFLRILTCGIGALLLVLGVGVVALLCRPWIVYNITSRSPLIGHLKNAHGPNAFQPIPVDLATAVRAGGALRGSQTFGLWTFCSDLSFTPSTANATTVSEVGFSSCTGYDWDSLPECFAGVRSTFYATRGLMISGLALNLFAVCASFLTFIRPIRYVAICRCLITSAGILYLLAFFIFRQGALRRRCEDSVPALEAGEQAILFRGVNLERFAQWQCNVGHDCAFGWPFWAAALAGGTCFCTCCLFVAVAKPKTKKERAQDLKVQQRYMRELAPHLLPPLPPVPPEYRLGPQGTGDGGYSPLGFGEPNEGSDEEVVLSPLSHPTSPATPLSLSFSNTPSLNPHPNNHRHGSGSVSPGGHLGSSVSGSLRGGSPPASPPTFVPPIVALSPPTPIGIGAFGGGGQQGGGAVALGAEVGEGTDVEGGPILVIQQVTEGSAAYRAGLRVDDRILEAAQRPVTRMPQLQEVLDAHCRSGGRLWLGVQRPGEGRKTVIVFFPPGG